MADIYFNPVAGASDGDFANLLDFFDDASGLIPAGRVSGSSDNCIMQGDATTGTLSCATCVGGSRTVSATGAITAVTSATALTWTSAGSITSPAINNTSLQVDCSFAISGSGNTFGAFTFSGPVTISGSVTIDSGATFSGAVVSTVALTAAAAYTGSVSAATVSFAGNFNGSTCTVANYSSGTASGGTVNTPLFQGVLAGSSLVLKNSASVNFNPSAYTSGSVAYSNTPTKILSVTVLGAVMTVPAEINVKTGTAYGAANGLTGSLAASGGGGVRTLGIGI